MGVAMGSRLPTLFLSLLLAGPLAEASAWAQGEHVHDQSADAPGWTWTWDANLFAGWNYQLRKFRDFERVESQNWLMGAGNRPIGTGRLSVHSMLSFEPFTIQ